VTFGAVSGVAPLNPKTANQDSVAAAAITETLCRMLTNPIDFSPHPSGNNLSFQTGYNTPSKPRL
jgi:hypothetical protein